MSKRWTVCGPLVLAASMRVTALMAQPVVDFEEEAAFTRPESWAMKYFASVNLLTGFGPPEAMALWSMDLGLETDWVPTLSDAERTVGFVGTKREDLNKTSIFIRPRFTMGLPKKLSLGLTYVPPIEAFGVKPHLFAVSIGRPVHDAPGWRMGLRAYGQVGTIRGDFTCDEETVAAGADPERNPFDCEAVSEDEYRLRTIGLDWSTAWRVGGSGNLEPYAGLAVNYLDTEFHVNARYAGQIDRTVLLTNGVTVSFTAGIGYALTGRLTLSGEGFYSPLTVVRPPRPSTQNDGLFNLRFLVTYRIR